MAALIALLTIATGSASAKGGGQIGEGFGTPGAANGQFFNPAMLGVDPVDGTIYTGDLVGASSEGETANYRIQQFTAGGEFKAATEIKRFPTTGKLASLHGIAVDHELGRIYAIEGCRVATAGGNLNCLSFGGKVGARKILVYSTTPEGSALKALTPITLPAGAEEIYEPQAIAVDPSSHDILILGNENAKHRIVQRISSAGVFGARYTDTTDKLKPASGVANSLAVSPTTGTVYTMTGGATPPATFTKVWQLPANLSSLEETPGVSAAASKEEWINGLETAIEGFFGGPQLAISTDGSTLYWKEQIKRSEEAEAGELSIRAYSLAKGETVGLWGFGSTRCKITTSTSGLAATTGGNLVAFDFGQATKTSAAVPAYGRKVYTFGPSGTGCKEPVAKFTINGKTEAETPTGINPGETVTFNASSSELAGGFRKELIWKFGDGTEQVVTPAKEGEEAPATVTHAYTSAGNYTVKLQIKLAVPTHGNPDPRERSFTVGTVASKFPLKVTLGGSGSGAVESAPAGINCGSTCEAEFESGKEVTLTATADAGSKFSGWSGAGCSGTGTCKVTISAAKEVTANFALEQRLLKVTRSGSGTGTVETSPVGINCGTTCEAEFDYGTKVTLSATPAGGSEFKGWSGAGCSGTGSCEVTLTELSSVDAQFATTSKALLKVTKSGIGSGPVTSTPAGIDCRGVCQASFDSGSTVTLSATPSPGTKPAVWTGCDEIVGANQCKVTLSGDRTVNALLSGISCEGADVTGAGSSLQKVAQQGVWGPKFAAEVCDEGTEPTVSYEPTGSGAGMAEWNYDGAKGALNTGLSFIGTDEAPTAAQIANIKSKAGGAELAVIPVAQTAIAVLANPPAGCEVEAITNSNLAGVFEGRITNWSKVEGASGSCNAPISRVVRKDGSGTTAQFKNYLGRLFAKGLSCTTGTTEGKAAWSELANTAWPESCPEKALSPVVRPSGNGGAALVGAVNATAGSIGYAALPDAVAGKAGSTVILGLQNNGQKKAPEATFADPASGEVANCAAMSYQVPTPLGARRDVDWSGVFGARPAIGGDRYPLCGLTYALAFHGYAAAGFSEGQYLTTRDYLYGYVVQSEGQADIDGDYYAALPAAAEPLYNVLAAARNAAAGISY